MALWQLAQHFESILVQWSQRVLGLASKFTTVCEKIVDSLNLGFLIHEMGMLVLPNEVVVIIKNNSP